METKESIIQRVQHELERVSDPILLKCIRELLITPFSEMRPWNYGPPHEYKCWRVVEHRPSSTGIVFCSEGFGPESPWGLVWLEGHLNMGDDASWFTTLEDAIRSSRAWDNPT